MINQQLIKSVTPAAQRSLVTDCSLRHVWVPGRESYTLASGDTARIQRQRLRSASSTDVVVLDSWRPRISGRRSSGMERVTAQCHLGAVIAATSENFSVSATTTWITLLSRGPEVLALSTTLTLN